MTRTAFIVLFLIIMATYSAVAQDDTPDPNFGECVLILHDIQTAISNRIDLTESCTASNACVEDGYNTVMCPVSVAAPLLTVCENNDVVCRNKALFASLVVSQYTPTDRRVHTASDRLVQLDPLAEAFIKFANDDYEGALSLLPPPDLNNLYWYETRGNLDRLYGRGLVLEIMNQPTEALEAYTLVINRAYDWFALPHFSRGLLYGEVGNVRAAAIEATWVERLLAANTPSLLPIVAPLTEVYRLDETQLSSWLQYPVTVFALNSAGNIYRDVSHEPPIPVQVAFDDDPNTMLVIGLPSTWNLGFPGIPANVFLLESTSRGFERFFAVAEGIDEGISLTQQGDGFVGQTTSNGAESYAFYHFILIPANLPDPRLSLGERRCEGGVISRLRPGLPIWIAFSDEGGFFYSESPGIPPEIIYQDEYASTLPPGTLAFDYPAYAVGEPICMGNQLWWQVTDGNGRSGWRAENDGTRYEINPDRSQLQTLFYCPRTLPIRLYNDAQALVIPGFGVNKLRDAASLSGNQIGDLPEGATVRVIGDPVCADGYFWWQVEYEGQTGWTAEGDAERYWLLPIESE